MSDEKLKYCPLKSYSPDDIYCDKQKCQWWTEAITTEKMTIYNCVIVLKAITNSDGYVVV